MCYHFASPLNFHSFLTAVKIIPKLCGARRNRFSISDSAKVYDSGQSAFVSKREQRLNFPRLYKIVLPCLSMQLSPPPPQYWESDLFDSHEENQGLTSVDFRIVRKLHYTLTKKHIDRS